MKNNKKTLKNFLLEEDAKISKKALLLWWIWVVAWMFWWITQAWHSSSPCWWSHSSAIWGSSHNSAIAHASHSSY